MTEKLTECGLFSSRDTLAEALSYGQDLISARVDKGSRMEAFTAMHVVSNTAIRLLTMASMPETVPYSEEEVALLCNILSEKTGRRPGWNVKELSQEEAQRMARTKLAEAAAVVFMAKKLNSPLADILGPYIMLVAAAYGMNEDAVVAEIEDLMGERK